MSKKCFVSFLINHLNITAKHSPIVENRNKLSRHATLRLSDSNNDGDGVEDIVTGVGVNNVITLFNEPIEYVWIQGVIIGISLISDDSMVQWFVDDGTGVILILIRLQSDSGGTTGYPTAASHSEFVSQYSIGDYILAQGSIVIGRDEDTGNVMKYIEALLVSPVKDPNMEALWMMEVVVGTKETIIIK